MIFLREILPEDRERMLDILTSEKVNRTYMLPDFRDREEAEPLFRRLMGMCRDHSKYLRAIATEDGLVGFLNQVELGEKEMELGYVIHPAFHGRGYMTRALELAMEELFAIGYKKIITGAFESNAASIRVMEKCGMVRMTQTDYIEYRGVTHKCVYYGKEQV